MKYYAVQYGSIYAAWDDREEIEFQINDNDFDGTDDTKIIEFELSKNAKVMDKDEFYDVFGNDEEEGIACLGEIGYDATWLGAENYHGYNGPTLGICNKDVMINKTTLPVRRPE